MLVDEALQGDDVLVRLDAGDIDELLVELVGEVAHEIEHVGHATRHARAEVLSGRTEDDDGSVRHVFAAVVAHALDDGGAAGVADAEALAGAAVREELTARRTIHHGVAEDAVLVGLELRAGARLDHDLAAAHHLADVVIRLAGEDEAHAGREKRTEALARAALELELDGALGQARIAVLVADFAGDLRANGAIRVVDLVFEADRLRVVDRLVGVLQDDLVERLVIGTVVALAGGVAHGGRVVLHDIDEQAREIDGVRLRMVGHVALLEALHVADHFVDRAEAEAGHDFANFLGDAIEEIHDVLGLALELAAQAVVERGDADRAGVQVALAHIDAAHRDHRGGAEIVFLGAEERRVNDVLAGLHAAIGAERDAVAQAVEHEHLVRLGDAKLPRTASILD